MACRLILVFALSFMAGCATQPEVVRVVETVDVPIEVYRHRAPPPWLAQPLQPERLPIFIAPTDTAAELALDAEQAAVLRTLLRTLTERDRAWREWAGGTDSE